MEDAAFLNAELENFDLEDDGNFPREEFCN